MTALSRAEVGVQAEARGTSRGWAVVASRELRDIWWSGRGPIIVLVFSLLLSVLTYLAASNNELNILDQRDTVRLVVQITVGIGIAVSLLFSADAISGERERETLESLLLTPVSRRQLCLGKLLAAASVWPVLLLVSLPYIWALKGGAALFTNAVLGELLVGSLLTVGFTSLGMVVSLLSNSNRLSLAASFFVFVALVAPTQLPLSGWVGDILTRFDPATAGSTFIERVISKQHGWAGESELLIAPVAAAIVALGIALYMAGRLRLRGGLER